MRITSSGLFAGLTVALLLAGGGAASAKGATKYKRFSSDRIRIEAPSHWKVEKAAGGLTIFRGRTGKLYLWVSQAGEASTKTLWNRFLRKVVGERIGQLRIGKYRETRAENASGGFAIVEGRSRLKKVGERGTGPSFHFAVLLEKRNGRAYGAALGGTRGAGYGKQARRLQRILSTLKIAKEQP